jgi:hypothetical protein
MLLAPCSILIPQKIRPGPSRAPLTEELRALQVRVMKKLSIGGPQGSRRRGPGSLTELRASHAPNNHMQSPM